MYNYQLNFVLNNEQLRCSHEIVEHYHRKHDVLLDAICGAGKTEILLEVIKLALNDNKKIGFACPRKQLTIELYERIKEYFNYNQVGLVVGGHSLNIQSNLIFLTTHQLFKYKGYFDLLIIDEIDAYHFCDCFELENSALQAGKQFIYLSATVPQKYYDLVDKDKLKIVENFKRHHLKLVPQVKLCKVNKGTIFINSIIWLNKLKNKSILIFVPTIKMGRSLSFYYQLLGIKNRFVSGKSLNNECLQDFKDKKFKILISTTVLERGITLKDLQVIVYLACHKIFDSTNLLQICGRVGRDTIKHDGNIVFLTTTINNSIKECINKLESYNIHDKL